MTGTEHRPEATMVESTVYFPPPKAPKRRPPWLIIGIVVALVILAGALVGTVILSRPTGSASPAATVTVSASAKAPKQKPVSCVNGSENGPCPGKEFEQGPPLPASLQGTPYTCNIMADTSECVVIFVRDPTMVLRRSSCIRHRGRLEDQRRRRCSSQLPMPSGALT